MKKEIKLQQAEKNVANSEEEKKRIEKKREPRNKALAKHRDRLQGVLNELKEAFTPALKKATELLDLKWKTSVIVKDAQAKLVRVDEHVLCLPDHRLFVTPKTVVLPLCKATTCRGRTRELQKDALLRHKVNKAIGAGGLNGLILTKYKEAQFDLENVDENDRDLVQTVLTKLNEKDIAWSEEEQKAEVDAYVKSLKEEDSFDNALCFKSRELGENGHRNVALFAYRGAMGQERMERLIEQAQPVLKTPDVFMLASDHELHIPKEYKKPPKKKKKGSSNSNRSTCTLKFSGNNIDGGHVCPLDESRSPKDRKTAVLNMSLQAILAMFDPVVSQWVPNKDWIDDRIKALNVEKRPPVEFVEKIFQLQEGEFNLTLLTQKHFRHKTEEVKITPQVATQMLIFWMNPRKDPALPVAKEPNIMPRTETSKNEFMNSIGTKERLAQYYLCAVINQGLRYKLAKNENKEKGDDYNRAHQIMTEACKGRLPDGTEAQNVRRKETMRKDMKRPRSTETPAETPAVAAVAAVAAETPAAPAETPAAPAETPAAAPAATVAPAASAETSDEDKKKRDDLAIHFQSEDMKQWCTDQHDYQDLQALAKILKVSAKGKRKLLRSRVKKALSALTN